MAPDPDLWAVAGSGLTLLAAIVVWLAPVLLAGVVTWISEATRALRAPALPRERPAAGRRVRPRAPRIRAQLGRRAATSTSP